MKWEGEYNTARPEDEIELAKQGNAWVPALASKRPSAPLAYPIAEHSSALTDSHLASLESLRETATPIQRAIGLAIRTAPLAGLWLVLAVGLFVALDGEPVVPFLLFCLLTAVTYLALNQQDYHHSASGLERHKADLAHDLQRQRDADDSDRKDKLVDAYIKKMLEG